MSLLNSFKNNVAPRQLSLFQYALLGIVGVGFACIMIALLSMALMYPRLPSIEAVTDYRPKLPLRVYTADGALIGEFGEERRTFVAIKDVPKHMQQAILAIEDDRFYEHIGIDFIGITRAVVNNLIGRNKQGASTITQQVARNFFLSSEQSFKRKFYEVLLSLKIESQLSKDQIFELYLNQIYLGQRAHGFAAASQVYFGKPLKDITIAQAAMLAGIPKAPGTNNPVANRKRAVSRQLYILERMLKQGYITAEQHATARAEPLVVRQSSDNAEVRADYVAEMARKAVYDIYKDDIYTAGLSIYTTILKEDQAAAYAALRAGLLDYDRRHAYRGPEGFVNLPVVATGAPTDDRDEAIDEALLKHPDNDDMQAAVVIMGNTKQVTVQLSNGEVVDITGEGLKLVATSLTDKVAPTRRISVGSIARVRLDGKKKDGSDNFVFVQIPEVEAAFIATNPSNGAVRALVGGFDFNRNKFNHVVQAQRQPGSSFKPFVYSAALEKGFTPSTIINDAPITIDAALTGGQAWEPKNYDGKFEGPMPMRQALAKSKNMVSIRLMQATGAKNTQDWITQFGFEAAKHPAYLTMALGAGATNPWEMAEAYGVFANGGYKTNNFIIYKVLDQKGKVLMQAKPKLSGDEANLVIPQRNAFAMDSLMRDIVRYGTAAKANVLKRSDLAGKTGTTNDSHDAWFAGYGSNIVAVTWVGFDTPKSLGATETGGGVALPIWIDYMAKILPKMPELPRIKPEGVTEDGHYTDVAGVRSLGLEDGAPPGNASGASSGRPDGRPDAPPRPPAE